ncbi:MAG TPA: alpha/beta hydrolase [Dermatophilaceae bacterium]|nr:alpha/beta hydrolase [Dermatophilaceae bacterium]
MVLLDAVRPRRHRADGFSGTDGPVRVPMRTRGIDLLAMLFGRSISQMSLTDIQLARQVVAPRLPIVDRITGPVVPGVGICRRQVPVRDGRTRPVRYYHPGAGSASEGGLPTVLFLHGGGFVLGNVVGYDPLCSFIADSVGALVVSVDYRLAPEHPAPAGIHDAFDVLCWLGSHAAELGGDADRLAIAGDSAGGNLSAVVAQLARDAGGPALRHQTLIYPAVDSTCLWRSKIVHSSGPILTRRETDTYFRYYLGHGPATLTPDDPLISPLLGRLDGLPPTLIQTAGLDPLRDEGQAYGRALRQAGVPVVATDYPRAPHGFASFPGASVGAWGHRAEIRDQLRRYLTQPQVVSPVAGDTASG